MVKIDRLAVYAPRATDNEAVTGTTPIQYL